MPQLLGIGYEALMVALALVAYRLLDAKTKYYLIHVATLMLIVEIWGQSTGLTTYDQGIFSLYLTGIPIVMPFSWFALIGFASFASKGYLNYLRAFIAGAFLDLLLELPMVYNKAWSNNFGDIHIIEGYPVILPFLYGFYILWFKLFLKYLAPKLEERKIESAGLLFAFVYIPSQLIISALLITLIPI
ncbi:MAG: hypothetical protein H3Z52_14590 [archaeon]|nr:hypothetical protein [archaeon]MCP8322143.1 hypothetical protein [archaeon]